ncbi:hypothetical protein CAter10_4281 [Collimonas arenae]|nr:hypothetical protein CAter10_4281 [Collimonas arenae]
MRKENNKKSLGERLKALFFSLYSEHQNINQISVKDIHHG